jgi:hypothetical protein
MSGSAAEAGGPPIGRRCGAGVPAGIALRMRDGCSRGGSQQLGGSASAPRRTTWRFQIDNLAKSIAFHDYALASHVFRRFFFINGHGANIETVQAAFPRSNEVSGGSTGVGQDEELQCPLANWWEDNARSRQGGVW